PVVPTAENPTLNVHYCEWQSEDEDDMDVYVAGGTTPARRGRPKRKPESSLGGSNRVPKIRRAVNPVEPVEMNTQPMKEEERSDGELYENPWENMQSPAIYMTTLEEIPTRDGDHDERRNDEGTPKQNVDIRLTKEELEEATIFFEKEKDLFAKDITELTQTDVIHH
ncbi:10082_t:CDS:2, partial [Acaulospora morrowiae]